MAEDEKMGLFNSLRKFRDDLRIQQGAEGNLKNEEQELLELVRELISEVEHRRKKNRRRSYETNSSITNLVRQKYHRALREGAIENNEKLANSLMHKASLLQKLDEEIGILGILELNDDKDIEIRSNVIDALKTMKHRDRGRLVGKLREKEDMELIDKINKTLLEKYGKPPASKKAVKRVVLNLLK